jgi:hypothetical protein
LTGKQYLPRHRILHCYGQAIARAAWLRHWQPHRSFPVYGSSRLGVFDRIFVALTEQTGRSTRLMIDATHLKAQRIAASLLKKGLFPAISDGQRAA